MHQLKEVDQFKEVDMLSANDKKEVNFINEFCMTYEECGEVGHSGHNCPEF
jgi:hypothetical protein